MSKSDDINTLFRRFGGDAGSYQEIVAMDQTQAAEQHWPLLGQLKPLAHAEAPPARRASMVGERSAQVEVVIYKTVPQIVHVPVPAPLPDPVVEQRVAETVPEPVAAVDTPVAPMPPAVVAPPPAVPVVSPVASASEPAATVSLKSVFDRMLPPAPEPVQPEPASPLKRLIKW